MKGSISKKRINGKDYYYHQFRDGKKVVTKSVSIEDAYEMSAQLNAKDHDDLKRHEFSTSLLFGAGLYHYCKNTTLFKKRHAFADIIRYLQGNAEGKVMALFGIRRVGKTTLMQQAIMSLPIMDFGKTAFIRIQSKDTMAGLDKDLKYLLSQGFEYVFIDEVTLLEDFTKSASMLSDIYGFQMKIVLSGTDSLGFLFAKHDELYDRVTLVHLTRIPFAEWSEVLGIDSIDQYIEMGGTMVREGVDYNQQIVTGGSRKNEYVDTAIAHNIEHSLALYEDGSHFCSLFPLYEKHELTNVINRIVEDTNHRLVLSTLDNDFKSHDYGSLKELIRKKQNIESVRSSLDEVNEKDITEELKKRLDIINKAERTMSLGDGVLSEISEYLGLLDVLVQIKEVRLPSKESFSKPIIAIPGLRFAQAKELLDLLIHDERIQKLPEVIQTAIKEKLLHDVKGRMIEEIILLETQNKVGFDDAFKLLFAVGEYDMVVLDRANSLADIYEVKLSSERVERQRVHLLDAQKNEMFESQYYPIRERIVLYMGEEGYEGGVHYRNIAEYLRNLYQTPKIDEQ